jgi:hypothetical protein
MARISIHTCDKCKREIDDEAEEYFVITVHRMPRDMKAAQKQFDFCAQCEPLVIELLQTPIADDIDQEFEDSGKPALPSADVIDIDKHHVD